MCPDLGVRIGRKMVPYSTKIEKIDRILIIHDSVKNANFGCIISTIQMYLLTFVVLINWAIQ